jgi:CheY-like chemotaxis protein
MITMIGVKGISIVLVESSLHNQKVMKKHLQELYPDCQVKILANGREAIDYLIFPANKYDLVILEGNVKSVAGPDVALAMKKAGIKVPVVLWTNDPNMLAKFDEIYGERLPEIEKRPCRKSNIAVILAPIIKN